MRNTENIDLPVEPRLERDRETTALRAEVAELRRQLQAIHHAADPLENPRRPKSRTVLLLAIAAVAVILAAFFGGFLPRSRRQAEVLADARRDVQALPVVLVHKAARETDGQDLTLPANIQAVAEAPVLARADGYLKRRYVDIGDRVREGQLLAEIEAPETDRQVEQARASVQQARAVVEQASAAVEQARVNQNLSRVTAERWNKLLMRGAVSRQENDQYQAQFQANSSNVQALDRARVAAEQNLAASEANLARLTEVQNYRQVRAPFAGVVTLRNIDTGALVTAGQTLLFRVAQTGSLRAYVNVPQSEADSVHPGQAAALDVDQVPGRSFEGRVVRTASALDPASRTLLTEIQLSNSNGLLMPGMFGQVSLRRTASRSPLLIPGESLIIGAKGTEVATVDQDNRIHIKPVVVGRDLGRKIEVAQGLQDGELVISSPNDQVRDGVRVKAEHAKQESE